MGRYLNGAHEREIAMAIETRPLHALFGVEIAGIDVRRVDDATFSAVADALDEHSVLLFRGQRLTDEEQVAFSGRFGPLEQTIRTIAQQARDLPEISNLSNVDAEQRLIPAGDKRNRFNAGNQMGCAGAPWAATSVASSVTKAVTTPRRVMIAPPP